MSDTQQLDSAVKAPRTIPRADHVGSLLRPERLKEAVEALYEPGHTSMFAEERDKDLTALRELEDECIRAAVQKQIDAGLDVVTDGEFRRKIFLNSFYDAVEGLAPASSPIPYPKTNPDDEEVFHPGVSEVVDRVRRIDNPALHETRFTTSITDWPVKVGFPAGSYWAGPFGYLEGKADRVYRDREEFSEHLLGIQQELIDEVIEAGVQYLQLDFPPYVVVCDPNWAAQLREQGWDLDTMVAGCVDADRRVLERVPETVTTGLHICRGNYKSRWIWQGSLEPVAEQIFQLPYDRFLIEWEDVEREGDYSPLRFVPEGPIVAMGIVSSKNPRVESEDELLREIEQASKYIEVDRLALAPQCGFASDAEGNRLSEDDQWRKLETISRVADRVWGRS
jgi:5-methyltetrahydropteroyltriglutamate--homocysteine methyltransferase